MRQIFTIAANTFTEAIRQPVYLIILGCSMGLILLSPYFTLFAMLENNRMIKDMGLSTLLLTGLLLAAFSASSVIYKEIENKTILTVISKPVSRVGFILGKYLGLLAGLLLAEYLLTLILIHVARTEITEAAYSDTDYPVLLGYLAATAFSLGIAVFANFFYKRPFTSSAVVLAIPIYTVIFLILCVLNNKWSFQPFTLDTQLALAAFLIFLATAVLTALATAGSTRLGPLSTLVLCIAVFCAGLLSDYLLTKHQTRYLASLDAGGEQELDQGKIPDGLQRAVAGKAATVPKMSVQTVDKGHKWHIKSESGPENYTVIQEQGRLNVYEKQVAFLVGYRFIPNFQIYLVADAVTVKRDIPIDYFYQVFWYTLLLLAAVLSLAVALFEQRETQ